MQICMHFSLSVMNVEVRMRVNVRILTDPQGEIYGYTPGECYDRFNRQQPARTETDGSDHPE
ncbi:hypothetical protein DVA44_20655 [Leclercia sp. W17]|nr:hypothetical protein DVA44_20655 [Leclercia sp. W17]